MTIRPVEAEFFHTYRRTDWQTDMTDLISRFLQFCERTLKTFPPV
jgi:hypothetical protein